MSSPRIDPVFPGLQVDEVYAVEKGTRIQPHGRVEVALLESVRKVVRVAANLTGHDKLVRARVDPFAAHRLPQLIETLP